jgi:trans-2,3-dihydro-3-hydroxyanthranilate isomerase
LRKIRVFHVDAFTSQRFGGNTAGVVLDGGILTEEEMQKIANELNLPESVFLLSSENPEADFKVKFFTPLEEINFCGHAIVGLSWLLATEHGWIEKSDTIVFETNIGLVPVKWNIEEEILKTVEMTQVAPVTKEIDIETGTLSKLIGISEADIDPTYPIKLGNTGNWHLLVPVKNQKAIDEAAPNLAELGKHNKENKISTTHLYTFNTTESGYDLFTRDFAPGIGIPEDPVTGAANGALAGLLYLEGFLAKAETTHLKIAQGHSIGRPGTLYVTVQTENNEPIIKVAGSAVITIEGVLKI